MPDPSRKQFARTLIAGVAVGGLCGAGVGLGWYPPLVGVAGAVVVAGVMGISLFRLKARMK